MMIAGLEQAEIQLPSARLVSLTSLIFLAAALPIAGQWDTLETVAIEDSHQDLSLTEVVERFRQRLPAQHKQDAYKLGRTVMRLSERHMVSPGLLLSVVETESSFRYDVVSKAGAVGLMQLLPRTAEEVAARYHIRSYHSAQDLKNPVVNLELGAAYLAYLRTRFGHSVHYLAAYNMGPTAMRVRIKNGNYELGAIKAYVTKIHGRILELRSHASAKSLQIKDRRYEKAHEMKKWL
jgi:soluble lytic murein transglycosylase-like protein